MRIIEKIKTAFISAIILSVILTFYFYVPSSQQNDNVTYSSFSGLLMIYFIASLPMYLVGGILSSLIYEKVAKVIRTNKYIASLVVYGVGGIIVNYFFYASIYNDGLNETSLFFLIIGILASWLFLHLQFITKKMMGQ